MNGSAFCVPKMNGSAFFAVTKVFNHLGASTHTRTCWLNLLDINGGASIAQINKSCARGALAKKENGPPPGTPPFQCWRGLGWRLRLGFTRQGIWDISLQHWNGGVPGGGDQLWRNGGVPGGGDQLWRLLRFPSPSTLRLKKHKEEKRWSSCWVTHIYFMYSNQSYA